MEFQDKKEEWYFETSLGRKGPVTIDTLKKAFLEGHVDFNTLVWKEGMEKGEPIVQCIDLFSLPEQSLNKNKTFDTVTNHSPIPMFETPALAIFLYFFAVIAVITGFIMFFYLWPEPPQRGYELIMQESEWLAIAYMPSIIWLSSGISGAIMAVIFANILIYLDKIEKNTRGV
ncbi:MAG: DUF4339 domain-containing protein [Syntrophales bacterium]|jgi:hypothetical protein|nr:DUF4339 domain-containing protein [Syntrophales bacterium]MCK9528723.1 DUF4339 domain-containing protein [Syntrophales bacterium]MDX9922986.1 DUF4339 domain-containing protein [Syntrophales bacterium]